MYLARDRGDLPGHIEWRFDFRGTGLVIHEVSLVATAKLFQNGVVKWNCAPQNTEGTKLPVKEGERKDTSVHLYSHLCLTGLL